MGDIVSGLEGVVCLVDDILVFGETQEEHDRCLTAVLARIKDAGLTLNREKCQFNRTSIKFLGQVVDGAGIRPDPNKLVPIQEMKPPTNITELRRFIGMANQLTKFSPRLTDRMKPLRDLLGTKTQCQWSEPQDTAFRQTKEALSSYEVLAKYDATKETVVSADASSYGLGAVLRQKQPDGSLRPTAYISRAMTETGKRYAQIEKEALAVTWACERFQDYLIGMRFQIETDHKPLAPLFTHKPLDQVRVQRFRLRMMRFSYSISHVPGKDLTAADTLSRAPISDPSVQDEALQQKVQVFLDVLIGSLPATERRIQEIKFCQERDQVCQMITQFCQNGWPEKHCLKGEIKKYISVKAELWIKENLLLRGNRIVVPLDLRVDILAEIHSGHQGKTKCLARARQSVWWPGINKQLEDLVDNCEECCKHRYQPAEPMIPSTLPDYPWQSIATDIFCWKKSTYLLAVDYFSRFIEIAKLSTTTSQDVINHLKSMFARHGIPEVVRSDNGPQYSSESFAQFAQNYGFVHVTSSPKYPQSNGAAERAVRTVKSPLMKNSDPYEALMAYRTTPLENGYSPAELLMGRKVRTTVPITKSNLLPCTINMS